jgi:hypothetical protein
MVDVNKNNYGLVIQDYDGFSFGGETRFVGLDSDTGRGKKILLGKFSMDWSMFTEAGEKHNVPLNSQNPYWEHIGEATHAGIKPRTFSVDCVVVQGYGLDYAPTGYAKLTIPLLNDLLFFNHRYYITDYFGSDSTTETPIYQLMNETSSLYYSLYSSQSVPSKGLPVIITGVSNFKVDEEDPLVMKFKMTLVEDAYD